MSTIDLPPINRGSDLSFTLRAQTTAGAPVDLTACTVAPYDAHPALSGRLTLTVPAPEDGIIQGRIEWHDAMPTGRVMAFRARISAGAEDIATPKFQVTVQ